MNVSKIITMNYKNLSRWRGKKTNPKQTQFKANPELAEGAVEKFLSLCPESATIIRNYVIRQLKRSRLRMFKFRLRLSIPTNKLLKLGKV